MQLMFDLKKDKPDETTGQVLSTRGANVVQLGVHDRLLVEWHIALEGRHRADLQVALLARERVHARVLARDAHLSGLARLRAQFGVHSVRDRAQLWSSLARAQLVRAHLVHREASSGRHIRAHA